MPDCGSGCPPEGTEAVVTWVRRVVASDLGETSARNSARRREQCTLLAAFCCLHFLRGRLWHKAGSRSIRTEYDDRLVSAHCPSFLR